MTEYIINCAGEKIPLTGKLFEARCDVGNLEDYIKANQRFIINKTQEWLDIPKISILMPIYLAGDTFIDSLKSVYNQNWSTPENVEIILYINQPLGEELPLTKKSIEVANKFINSVENSKPAVRLIYEQLNHGLPEVYQRSFSSLVGRIQSLVNTLNFNNKDDKISKINQLMNTVFAIVDDDLIFKNSNELSSALEQIKTGQSIVTGQIEITKVKTSYPKWDNILTSVMNLYFNFKQELGTSTLTPRGISVKDMFHQPAVQLENDYADQIWFASGANNKHKLIVKTQTSLQEETYPSNAKMTGALAYFLETGKEVSCLDIFESVKALYKSNWQTHFKYSHEDVEQLIKNLKTRDISKIYQYCKKFT